MDPLRHQQTVDSDIFWLPPVGPYLRPRLTENKRTSLSDVGIFLSSHSVARALFSALQGLTSVFGMGTGGPPASSTPTQLLIMRFFFGSPSWTRTNDNSVNSRVLYRLSYGGICLCFSKSGDSWGNRTPVAGVRGRSLNRLTNEPCG